MRMYSTLIHLLGMTIVLGYLAGASFSLPIIADPVRPLHVALPDPGPPLNAVSPSLPLPQRKAGRPLVRGLDPAPSLPLPLERRKSSPKISSASLGLETYYHTVYPPAGFHFCDKVPGGYLDLYHYGAFFLVLYCTSEGDPAGTLAIWSYVAPEFCSTTNLEGAFAKGTAIKYEISIDHNGVGTITTRSQAVPIVNNRYTVAGPNWLAYHDAFGDLTYAYNGTSGSLGPYTYPNTYGQKSCGTPFAIVINNQFGTVTVPQCDRAGSVRGWIYQGVGERQDQCIAKGISDAQVYLDVDRDASGAPMTTVKLVVYSVSRSAQATSDL